MPKAKLAAVEAAVEAAAAAAAAVAADEVAKKRIIQKQPNSKEISTADLFNAIVNAPAPGPMLWNHFGNDSSDDDADDNAEDEEQEDEYPTYEDEIIKAEKNLREEEKRKFLNELKLASDLEDEKNRDEEVRAGRRTNKGLASTWFFSNGTGAAGVVKGNKLLKLFKVP
uniref:Uncharacterized protein n=1 Tax=Panagrolaimus superbus TaxID=310955 RepID=A0A914YDJ5_9BILA